jgi:hypothetical protein
MDSTAGNILTSQIIKLDGDDVATVSGTSPIYSDAVIIPKTGQSLVFEILWSGALTGTIAIQGALQGPWQDIPASYMYGVTQPSGTNYTGDLEATTLENETIGSAIIELNVGTSKARVVYTNVSGTGEMRVFARAKVSA